LKAGPTPNRKEEFNDLPVTPRSFDLQRPGRHDQFFY
jgi:hypothetical protein